MSDPHPDDVIWCTDDEGGDNDRVLTRQQVDKALDDLSSFQGNVRHVIECYRDALAELVEVVRVEREELSARLGED
jgi:hypothetical protein